MKMRNAVLIITAVVLTACAPPEPPLDVILAGGTVYTGDDAAGTITDVGFRGDRIVAVGSLADEEALVRLDVGEP